MWWNISSGNIRHELQNLLLINWLEVGTNACSSAYPTGKCCCSFSKLVDGYDASGISSNRQAKSYVDECENARLCTGGRYYVGRSASGLHAQTTGSTVFRHSAGACNRAQLPRAACPSVRAEREPPILALTCKLTGKI